MATHSIRSKHQNPKLQITLRILLVMIIGLMALGAGVRAMNAGLSCPDWPLCFGKVIPDFHVGVWFEFVHRAYAGLVALVFLTCAGYVLFSPFPKSTKRAAVAGLVFLFLQIGAGALTVLWLVKWVAVTSHLMLATLFFLSVLAMIFSLQPAAPPARELAPRGLLWISGLLSIAVLMQILLGGIVASTYAGSVCVDWPLCAGQWVPTWSGPIGHQIMHRFLAYGLAIGFLALGITLQVKRSEAWMSPRLRRTGWLAVVIVFLQVVIGVANLVLYIPPALTVVHQSVAIVLLATSLRLFIFLRESRARSTAEVRRWQAYPVEASATPS